MVFCVVYSEIKVIRYLEGICQIYFFVLPYTRTMKSDYTSDE